MNMNQVKSICRAQFPSNALFPLEKMKSIIWLSKMISEEITPARTLIAEAMNEAEGGWAESTMRRHFELEGFVNQPCEFLIVLSKIINLPYANMTSSNNLECRLASENTTTAFASQAMPFKSVLLQSRHVLVVKPLILLVG